MAKHIRTVLTAEAELAKPVQLIAQKPMYQLVPLMGRKSLDDLDTDLVLLPVLAGMKVPRDLHARKTAVAELIKQSIKDEDFQGKRGETLLINVDSDSSQEKPGPKVLLAGLGRHDQFCGRVAFQMFKLLIEEAIEQKARRVTIPFVPNRGTSSCLTMKGMAHKLNLAVTRVFEEQDREVALRELQIFCTPQAKLHIEKGLAIPVDGTSGCRD